ncbi:unnamed protein product [Amoebophrya sp. A25]|nr:unnamed protein product [Amoebophrya sp. A25]|eukprot:GSA25T00007207001.1
MSSEVLQNWSQFATGMSLVQKISTDLTFTQVLVANARRKLQHSRTSLHEQRRAVVLKTRQARRLTEVRALLRRLLRVQSAGDGIAKTLKQGRYLDSVRQLKELQTAFFIGGKNETMGGATSSSSRGGEKRASHEAVDVVTKVAQEDHDDVDFCKKFVCIGDLQTRIADKRRLVENGIMAALRSVLFSTTPTPSSSSNSCSRPALGPSSSSSSRRRRILQKFKLNLDAERYESILLAAGELAVQVGTSSSASSSVDESKVKVQQGQSARNPPASSSIKTTTTSSSKKIDGSIVSEFFLDAVVSMGTQTQNRYSTSRDHSSEIPSSNYTPCLANLLENFCDLLYRHHHLCEWHAARVFGGGEEAHADSTMRGGGQIISKVVSPSPASNIVVASSPATGAVTNTSRSSSTPSTASTSSKIDTQQLLHDVLVELTESKRLLWDKMQSQVALLLLGWRFDELGGESTFLHCLFLLSLFVEEGDSFMSHTPHWLKTASTRRDNAPGGQHQYFSTALRNAARTICNQYLESLHRASWGWIHSFLENDSWQRVPVPASFRLLDARKLAPRFRILKTSGQSTALTFAQTKRMLWLRGGLKQGAAGGLENSDHDLESPDDWRFVNLFSHYDGRASLIAATTEDSASWDQLQDHEDSISSSSSVSSSSSSTSSSSCDPAVLQAEALKLREDGPVLATATIQVGQLLERCSMQPCAQKFFSRWRSCSSTIFMAYSAQRCRSTI